MIFNLLNISKLIWKCNCIFSQSNLNNNLWKGKINWNANARQERFCRNELKFQFSTLRHKSHHTFLLIRGLLSGQIRPLWKSGQKIDCIKKTYAMNNEYRTCQIIDDNCTWMGSDDMVRLFFCLKQFFRDIKRISGT